MITSIDQLDPNKTYTYADYLTWQFDEMVELIRGKVFRMSPAPGRKHQEISSQLLKSFFVNFDNTTCKLFHAPFDVRLLKKVNDEAITTVVQPDLCVICDLSKLDERGCLGAPELIIEILSKRTKKKDYHDKFDLYEENGVQEYWLVDPDSESVEIFSLVEGSYESVGIFDKDNPDIKGVLFPELTLQCSDIFES